MQSKFQHVFKQSHFVNSFALVVATYTDASLPSAPEILIRGANAPFEEVIIEESATMLASIRPTSSKDTLAADTNSNCARGNCHHPHTSVTTTDTEDSLMETSPIEPIHPNNSSAQNFKAVTTDTTSVSAVQDKQDFTNDDDAYAKHMESKLMEIEKVGASSAKLEFEKENGVMRGNEVNKEGHFQACNGDEPTTGTFPLQDAHSPILIIPCADQDIADAPDPVYGPSLDGYGTARSGESTNEGLAVAITVEDTFNDAIEYDPDAETLILKNRRFCVYTFGAVLLCTAIIVGVIGIVVALAENRNGRDTFPPTQSPSISPSSREEKIYRDQFMKVVGEAVMQRGSPHDKAANWIISADPLSLSADASNLIQRYLLALFYYTTTDNGRRPWPSCNPPEGDENTTCVFSKLEIDSVNESTYYISVPAVRWLSGTHECEWVGHSCDLLLTTKLEICKFFIIKG